MNPVQIEYIVGYDAREMSQNFERSWPPSRRQTMLIRQDIVKPLSTQTAVWPSVFDLGNGLNRPAWTGILGLWENLPLLQAHLSTAWGQHWEPCWLIAITVLPPFTSIEQTYWDGQLRPTHPATVNENWHLLGYDVSDGYLLSGLMDCGHPESDAAYQPYLNSYHLLTDLEHALTFKAEMNVGNHQHAPFFIYRLYRIFDAAEHLSHLGFPA